MLPVDGLFTGGGLVCKTNGTVSSFSVVSPAT